MPLNREATLKAAEKLLRQGKLDGAIAEYVRLVEDQPRDFNSMNVLGDLYVRAGDFDRAVAQFTHVADHLYAEGFFQKAGALYKKALKIKPEHEHTLLRLSDIAVQQELTADARLYLGQLVKQRRSRGDQQGAAECVMRLGALDGADGDARLAAADAARQLGLTDRAVQLSVAAADAFRARGRAADALDALVAAAELAPNDVELRARVARECLDTGDAERARRFVTPGTAGDSPDLLLAVARAELAGGSLADARAALTRIAAIAVERHGEILTLGEELAQAGRTDAAYECVEVVADAALLGGDVDAALSAIERFVQQSPHVPALLKLVEVAVDAGRDDLTRRAQAKLADVYLDTGRAAEARAIAEDLVAHDPSSEEHVSRLRRALEALGVPDADLILSLHANPQTELDDVLDLNVPEGEPETAFGHSEAGEPTNLPVFDAAANSEVPPEMVQRVEPGPAPQSLAESPTASVEEPAQAAREETASAPRDEDEAFVLGPLEVDLSDVLASFGATVPTLPPPRPPAAQPAEPPRAAAEGPRDLDDVFAAMRVRITREQETVEAEALYQRGLEHLEHGRLAEAIADLQAAARAPMLRFKAASRLGRLFVGKGELKAAVDWLERAAEAPAPSHEEGIGLLYDLADCLERLHEPARALAILMEIESDVEGYRDVRERIGHLSRPDGSHGA